MKRSVPTVAALLAFTTSAAGQYRASVRQDGQIQVVSLVDVQREMEVLIAPSLGMNSYSLTVKGQPVFWMPGASLEESRTKGGMMGNPLLWPWANRIDGMSYKFEDRTYVLNGEIGNVRPGPNNTPIHGLLVRESRWKVAKPEAGPNGASVAATLDFHTYPELATHFPFAHSITVEYRLNGGALEIATTIRNLSAARMPVSLGYHPYFKLMGAPRDEWTVQMPVATRYKLSPRLVPTGETEPNPYPAVVKLSDVVLDDVFGDLKRDADGFARFLVKAGSQTLSVEYGKGFDVAVVYAPKGRDFMCIEPMTAVTNAFNAAAAGWYKGLPVIEPGGTWSAVYKLRPGGF